MEFDIETSDYLKLNIYVSGVLASADTSPSNPMVFLTVTRLSDDVVIINNQQASTISTGSYQYLISASNNANLGRYKAVWTYTISAVPYTKTEYYSVVVGYANAQEVRDEFPELSTKTNDEIYRKERLARNIINTFCDQTFDYELGVTKTILTAGKPTNHLRLPKRLWELTTFSFHDTAENITDLVEIESDYYVRPIEGSGFEDIKRDIQFTSGFFIRNTKYDLEGNWGWESVPEEIELACRLLIKDYMMDDSLLRQHGVWVAQMGDTQMTFKQDLWATTGNYDVDILLGNYVLTSFVII